MLALQLVIGVGIALLFPLLIYTGVAAIKAPPRSSDFLKHVRGGISEQEKRADEAQIRGERDALQVARIGYAKLLFTVMAPAGLAAMLGGYFIGINAIGIGLLTGGILCSVYGYGGYWQALSQRVRFVSILAGLLMLLFIGMKYIGIS
jgi:hypothetical protein